MQEGKCPIPKYEENVTYVQVFKMPIDKMGTVKGRIAYQAIGRYVADPTKTLSFELNVGECQPLRTEGVTTIKEVKCSGNRRIFTTYPKGVIRTVWWRLRHPFGPSYISRKSLPYVS
jgi:hypothetical protein